MPLSIAQQNEVAAALNGLCALHDEMNASLADDLVIAPADNTVSVQDVSQKIAMAYQRIQDVFRVMNQRYSTLRKSIKTAISTSTSRVLRISTGRARRTRSQHSSCKSAAKANASSDGGDGPAPRSAIFFCPASSFASAVTSLHTALQHRVLKIFAALVRQENCALIEPIHVSVFPWGVRV